MFFHDEYAARLSEGRGRRRGGGNLLGWALLGGAAYYLFKQGQTMVSTAKGESAYLAMVQSAAAAAGIPASMLAGIVSAESSWNNAPNSNSAACQVACTAGYPKPGCARGIAQVKPGTAADVGVTSDLCDPATNLMAAARYLKRCYDRFGDWTLAARCYNAGPGSIQAEQRGESNALAQNSVGYGNKVVSTAAKYQARGIA